MCIRDRKNRDGVIYFFNHLLKPAFPDLTVEIHDMVAEGDKVTTVSYTHLRAHETVLDLVCRLLLEKKNNTKTHNTLYKTSHMITNSTNKILSS